MIQVQDAEREILSRLRSYGTEKVALTHAVGRVLAAEVCADRDFPPFNRVAMDGIAIAFRDYEAGLRTFAISGIQAAGTPRQALPATGCCMEVMTGAVCPEGCDTVIRYEDLVIEEGRASIIAPELRQRQNVHIQGGDRKKGAILLHTGTRIGSADLGVLATVGSAQVEVMRLPRVLILSNGDELVEVNEQPLPHQIRKSNVYALQAMLAEEMIPGNTGHLPDDPTRITEYLMGILEQFDVLLLSGGVSMGKFDHLPAMLEKVGVQCVFHKVEQRPGKPFWFGEKTNGPLVFAFPGNPVSTYLCALRYFMPWLRASLGLMLQEPNQAVLATDQTFKAPLTCFLPCKLTREASRLVAVPRPGMGSGDLANLVDTDGFLELPSHRTFFYRGESFPFWLYC